MLEINIEEFINKLQTSDSNNICILDNNLVEFLNLVERKNLLDIEDIFEIYDFIIIPKWVYTEVSDSQHRIDYTNSIRRIYPDKLIIIEELDYSKMTMYREADLYHLFCYACSKLARENGYLKRILADKDISEMEEYEIWITLFYDNAFEDESLDNRGKRKNAGEISITVLAYILAIYYKNNIDSITIFSYDEDCYIFIKNCEERILKFKEINNVENMAHITFKSNDCILAENIKKRIISVECDGNKIVDLKKSERYIRYIEKKIDGSTYSGKKLIPRTDILDFYLNERISIIF